MVDKMSRGARLRLCQYLHHANINVRLEEQCVEKIPMSNGRNTMYGTIYKENYLYYVQGRN